MCLNASLKVCARAYATSFLFVPGLCTSPPGSPPWHLGTHLLQFIGDLCILPPMLSLPKHSPFIPFRLASPSLMARWTLSTASTASSTCPCLSSRSCCRAEDPSGFQGSMLQHPHPLTLLAVLRVRSKYRCPESSQPCHRLLILMR